MITRPHIPDKMAWKPYLFSGTYMYQYSQYNYGNTPLLGFYLAIHLHLVHNATACLQVGFIVNFTCMFVFILFAREKIGI